MCDVKSKQKKTLVVLNRDQFKSKMATEESVLTEFLTLKAMHALCDLRCFDMF